MRDVDDAGARRGDEPRPDGPARFADLTEMIDAASAEWPATSRAEVAAATAAVVVQAGRSPGDRPVCERFVALADRVGLDTLAALWQDADPVSLPRALWALYLLRQWCQLAGEEVTRLWRRGEPLAPVDAAVAGVAEYADCAAVRDLADAVLTGVYRGDLAVALERAAAFFRVVAAGRRSLAAGAAEFGAAEFDADVVAPEQAAGEHATEPDAARTQAELAARNEQVAAALTAAAARWRAGTLR